MNNSRKHEIISIDLSKSKKTLILTFIFSLECIIVGNPLPELIWLFNDRKVIVGNDYQRQSETLNPHTIRHQLIVNPKHKKIGIYKAQASKYVWSYNKYMSCEKIFSYN